MLSEENERLTRVRPNTAYANLMRPYRHRVAASNQLARPETQRVRVRMRRGNDHRQGRSICVRCVNFLAPRS
jgi:hypothetical protein